MKMIANQKPDAMMVKFSHINSKDERIGQYRNKSSAILAAKLETMRTGVKHMPYLTHTYRDLVPRICWTVKIGSASPAFKRLYY